MSALDADDVEVERTQDTGGKHSGLTLYTSNNMENLADICAVLMSEYPLSDPFVHENIVIMNLGMKTFLTQRIATQNKISAMCDFPQVWQFIFKTLHLLYPDLPEKDLFSRDHLTWNIYSQILPLRPQSATTTSASATAESTNFEQSEDKGYDIYKKLRQYLEDDQNCDKAYELAAKIADTLDQYQMYRPRWILQWNQIPLSAFDDYERDPNDPQNPINVFIESECRRFRREKSGFNAVKKAVAAAAEGNSSPLENLHQNAGIKEREQMVRELFKNNVWQIKLWCLLRHNLCYYDAQGVLPLDVESKEFAWLLDHLDRAQVMTSLIRDLKNAPYGTFKRNKLYERVFIFGVSSMPRIVIEFLDALSRHCFVNVMLLNPCREYWADIAPRYRNDFERYVQLIQASCKSLKTAKTSLKKRLLTVPAVSLKESDYDQTSGERVAGHPLLLSYGQQGRDNLYIFFDRDPVPDNITCFSEPDVEHEFIYQQVSIDPDGRKVVLAESSVSPDEAIGAEALTYMSAQEAVAQGSLWRRNITEVRGGNLLAFIQKQLLSLEQKPQRYIIAPDDVSFSIHSCHTRRREVEVLHDAILECFNRAKLEGRKLFPRDIVVMVPAINDYAPHITAVFGGNYKEGDDDYIPFVISDRTETEANTVAQSLLKLLEIGTARITSAVVIDLLSEDAIARRFGLRRDEIDVISAWLKDTNIYWGLDDADVVDVAEIKIPGTFEQGVERMLLGSLIGNTDALPCFSEIEGSDSVILGKFWDFLQALRELRARFTPELALTPSEWAQELRDMLMNRFFDDSTETLTALTGVEDVIKELSETISHIYKKPSINLPVFAATLRQSLTSQRNYQPFLREKVNFCSLVPMRAVPFQHVFILGLNDRDFPREERSPGFNLMGSRDLFERGDRSRGIDDRFLFLEAILSARQSIYFSYIGQSPIDKTQQNSSIVLSELLYYVTDTCAVEGEDFVSDGMRQNSVRNRILVQEHLNGYHAANFLDLSYQKDQLNKAARTVFERGLPEEVEDQEARKAIAATYSQSATQSRLRYPSFKRSFIQTEDLIRNESAMLGAGVFVEDLSAQQIQVLDIKQLLSFCKAPSRYFLRNVLEISFANSDRVSQDEDESFELSYFDQNNFVADLINIPAEERQALLERKAELGQLPYGIFKNKLCIDVLAKCEQISGTLVGTFNLNHLGEIGTVICPKSRWLVTLPKRYFAVRNAAADAADAASVSDSTSGACGGLELGDSIENFERLVHAVQDKSKFSDGLAVVAAKALHLDEDAPRPPAVAAMTQDADNYHFEITLQAVKRSKPVIVYVYKGLSSDAEANKVKEFFTADGDAGEKIKLPQAVFFYSSMIFMALEEAIAQYLANNCSSATSDISIVDGEGGVHTLTGFSCVEMNYIIYSLLIFYLQGLSSPFPCMKNVIKGGLFDESGELTIRSEDDVSFSYDKESAYLFGDLNKLFSDPKLKRKSANFLDFYIKNIATHFVI